VKTIVIYSESDLGRDPRVARQIECLCTKYRVVAMGTAPPRSAVQRFIQLGSKGVDSGWGGIHSQVLTLFKKRGAEEAFAHVVGWFCARIPALFPVKYILDFSVSRRRNILALAAIKPDLVVANDLTGLPVAWAAVGRRVPIIFDAHEYYPGQFVRTRKTYPRRAYASYLLKRFAKHASAFLTIGEGIASVYRTTLGLTPIVITNAPEYVEQAPSPVLDNIIRIVHHGVAKRGRSLEIMIEAHAMLDNRFEMHFYLVESDPGYVEELKISASANTRVFFHEPVQMKMLPRILNTYDVGIFILPPTTINSLYVLPNKLFEFVQARLGIAVGPSPEMASFVKKYSLGIVARDFSAGAMAEALRGLDGATVARFKANADIGAGELSSTTNMEKLKSIVASLIGS
jgi:hypothetical protein